MLCDTHVLMWHMWCAAPAPSAYYKWLDQYQSPEWIALCARLYRTR